MQLCDGSYKNGKPCRNRHLPGYTRCGRHGGHSLESVIRTGNLTELRHIYSNTELEIKCDYFYKACYLYHVDIVKFMIDTKLVCDVAIDFIRYSPDIDPKILQCLPGNSRLSEALNLLSIKTEPCCICLSEEDIDVLVLPCCKNVMCSKCIKSWNSKEKSCAFCRAKIF